MPSAFEPDCRIHSRRQMLTRSGMGLGGLALGELLQEFAVAAPVGHPLLPKQPHFPVKAKHVIHLFMNGGPSHVDTFDPKPEVQKRGGEKLPDGNLKTERPTGTLYPSPYKFKKIRAEGDRS